MTFVSDRGELTTSVAHAVWLWLQNPGSTWTMVQRITPWEQQVAAPHPFEEAVAAAFDLLVPDDHAVAWLKRAAGSARHS